MKRSIDRVQFLRGDLRGSRQSIRPPWAKFEADFTDNCERCDACIEVCPTQILSRGSGGFPIVDFSHGACTFCGKCVDACKHHAFDVPQDFDVPAWELEVSITEECLSVRGIVCRSCGDACESAAIRFRLETGGRSIPLIENERCNGCGECLALCPNRSISILPSQRDCAA
ncbi:MAG: ferredoxin-type protein NapF [Candidatus Thiodiazotropha sp. (ex Notomyrtea botanica)]|nr:ferredoxin-type protein NapF [Candidatus Thiodiazotropha sp. (ex Notomyrtea botanica)]